MLTTNHHEGNDMTVNLTKGLPSDIAILLAIGGPSAAYRHPETRAALADTRVPFNTRLELRTGLTRFDNTTAPLVPAGSFRARLAHDLDMPHLLDYR